MCVISPNSNLSRSSLSSHSKSHLVDRLSHPSLSFVLLKSKKNKIKSIKTQSQKEKEKEGNCRLCHAPGHWF
ncbi:hypothetical protein Scep_007564 [Stephania cephalantha]|uniref:Uncharacterized protein n=1 Tax=Stephania cephalantha TaxID=152367 RepID=A0AAP0PLX5_9MAGN